MTNPDNSKLLYANFNTEREETDLAAQLIINHYSSLGAVAVVFMDKDDTTLDMETGIVTDSRLEGVIAEAQRRGIFVGYDSDSAFADLKGRLGMKGLPIAERGGMIYLPDGTEIHLVRSGEWFMELLGRFTDKLHSDRSLRNNTAILEVDPWSFLHNDIDIPGTQSQVVMVNRGRRVTASIVTGLLDQSQGGKIVRHTPESRAFYEQMATLFMQTRDELVAHKPFPDLGGMVDDKNRESELVIFKSGAASKQRANGWMAQVLGLPVLHIGDNAVTDNMLTVPGVITLAVGNGGLKDVTGVAYAAQAPMASGVVELFENYIFPNFGR